jgi:nucleoside-diphosphate-sugar epimerase
MTILIAGCGYLGEHLARRLLGSGHRVVGVSRSPDSAARLTAAGITCVAGDLGDKRFVGSLPPADAVVHCAASGRGGGPAEYRRVYVDGCRHLLDARQPGQFVFTSSTSVYPQTDGSWVTEFAPADPAAPLARLLREAEDGVLEAGGCVLRLAGLYGPSRSVLLQRFLLGEAAIDVLPGDPAATDGRWINQIHRDDAAAAVGFALDRGLCGVFNTADGTPLSQRAIYTDLARRFDRPVPAPAPPDAARKRAWTHKRVSSAKLVAAGWRPRFPSWFDALDHDPELIPSVLARMPPRPAG